MNANEYIMRIRSLSDKLAAIGEPLSFKDQLVYVLNCLGSEYNGLVPTINARSDSLTLEDVHSLLLGFDFRLEQQNCVEDLSLAQANLTSFQPNKKPQKSFQPNSYGNTQRNTFQHTLYHFSQPSILEQPQNHSPASTLGRWQPRPNTSPNPSQVPKPQCQICGKLGHTALICYHRGNFNYQPPASYN